MSNSVNCLLLLYISSRLRVVPAVDRFLAVFLHLRYQELVTSKRVSLALAALWFISGVAAFIFVSLPSRNSMVIAIIELVGLLLATVAYFRIYKAVRYHRNQIQNQVFGCYPLRSAVRLRQLVH